MEEDIPTSFWKEYINSDCLKREKLLNKTMLKSIVKICRSDIKEDLVQHMIITNLMGYFDDLINVMAVKHETYEVGFDNGYADAVSNFKHLKNKLDELSKTIKEYGKK